MKEALWIAAHELIFTALKLILIIITLQKLGYFSPTFHVLRADFSIAIAFSYGS